MNTSEPQFIYMVLILPCLFGLTLVGEGVVKLAQEHVSGWFNLLMGMVFLGVVVVSYLYLSGSV